MSRNPIFMIETHRDVQRASLRTWCCRVNVRRPVESRKGDLVKNCFRPACLVAGGFIGLAVQATAAAQTFPNRPVRLIVQGVTSSGPDLITRPIAQRVSQSIGQPVIVENRPGAGGLVAAQMAIGSPADGYTLLVAASGTISIAPFLMKKPPYDPLTDLAPVTLLAVAPLIITAHPSLAAASVKDLVGLAKSGAKKIQFGTPGVGSVQHLAMEMFSQEAGVSLDHIPYKSGASAVIDAVGGQIQLVITAIPVVLPHIRASRLRPIAVTSAMRSTVFPDVPSVAEAGLAGFDAVTWYGLYAPRNTPGSIVNKLYSEVRKATEGADVKAAAMQEGVELDVRGPQALGDFQRIDMARWQKIIRDSHIVLE
jgi:tripartite-type tricarboxylate transporter receptor subunit TctC